MSKTAKSIRDGGKLKKKTGRKDKKGRKQHEEKAERIVFLKSGEAASESFYFESAENGWEEFEGDIDDSMIKVRGVLSRTSMVLYDYHQFKAARTIQTCVRGWLARTKYRKCREATKLLQRAWRGFYAKQIYYNILEQTVKVETENYHNECAREIQSAWRGWWVRHHIHDHYSLKGKQIMAAEDLLYCVAFKLHHLMRTYRIPGVYSIRNSQCLSKVEKLLAAMTFKQHNERVRWARARLETDLNNAKKHFKECEYFTPIPFKGPNFNSLCAPKCSKMYREDDADKCMHQILSVYDEVQRTDPMRIKVLKNLKHKPQRRKTLNKIVDPTNFCTDIVNSMRRWKVLSENNVSVDPNVLKTPQNVENFLNDMENMVHEHCQCESRPQDVERCN